uniref:Putative cytochrome n=1 Tax=Ixodes ricinus TaxID=34613 RepID=V5H9A9_IXORI
MMFILAGHGTTSSVIAFALYLLALNPEAQNKLRREVDVCIKENGPKPSMDVIDKATISSRGCFRSIKGYFLPSLPRIGERNNRRLYTRQYRDQGAQRVCCKQCLSGRSTTIRSTFQIQIASNQKGSARTMWIRFRLMFICRSAPAQETALASDSASVL